MKFARTFTLVFALSLLVVGQVNAQTPPGTGFVDLSFGSDGSVEVPGGVVDIEPSSPPGAFVVLTANGARRIGSTGELDTTFGVGGVALGSAGATGMSAMPDGKFLVVSLRNRSGEPSDVMLRRYLPNGSPDVSFGNGGLAVLDGSGSCGEPSDDSRASVIALTDGGAVILMTVPYNTGDKYLGTVWTYHAVRVSSAGTRSTPFSDDACAGPLSSMSAVAGADGTAVVQRGDKVMLFEQNGSLRWLHDYPGGTLPSLLGVQPTGHVIVGAGVWMDRFDALGSREERWAERGGNLTMDKVGGFIRAGSSSGGILLSRLDERGEPDTTFGIAGSIVVCRPALGNQLSPVDGYIGLGASNVVTRLGSERRDAVPATARLFFRDEGGWSDTPRVGTLYINQYLRDIAVTGRGCGGPGVASISVRWRGVEYKPNEYGHVARLPAGRGNLTLTTTDMNGGQGVQERAVVVDDRAPVVRVRRIGPRSFGFRVSDTLAGPRPHAPLRLPARGCHTKALVFRDKAGNTVKLVVRANGNQLAVVRRTTAVYRTEGDTSWAKCRVSRR